jgi:hypothetical protein
MNTPTTMTGNSGRKPIGLAMALVLASAFGALAATPALARDDHGHRGGHDRGHWHGHDHGGFGVGIYADPVYVPQPVYYDPQPSPGISIALPLNIHIR